jgi:hypothetical protein
VRSKTAALGEKESDVAKSTSTIELLKVADVPAELQRRGIKIGERTLKAMIANREIASIKIAGRVYIKPDAIEAFIERSTRTAVTA